MMRSLALECWIKFVQMIKQPRNNGNKHIQWHTIHLPTQWKQQMGQHLLNPVTTDKCGPLQMCTADSF